MFDHSIAVLSNISRSLKKYLNITSIVTQMLFMSYYAYLIVVNVDKLLFLIGYALIELIALIILIVDIVTTFKELDHKAKRMKAKTKRRIRYVSWFIKMAVIVFNIVVIVQGKATEAGMIFLIFSATFLLIQILLTVTSTLFTYYLDLLLYSLKMDYEVLVDVDNPEQRPVGKVLESATKDLDYREDVNDSSIKYEVRNAIKKELDTEFPMKINNKTVTKKQAERLVLHYYRKANKYYNAPHKLKKLLDSLDTKHITYLTYDDKLFVHLFFASNHLSKNFVGISKNALKLVIATLLFVDEGNDRSIVDLSFKAIIKELFDVNTWAEPLTNKAGGAEYRKVLSIIKDAKAEYKRDQQQTIASELGNITMKEVEKKMDLPPFLSKILHHILDKKR